jgi:hypothetical protein
MQTQAYTDDPLIPYSVTLFQVHIETRSHDQGEVSFIHTPFMPSLGKSVISLSLHHIYKLEK